MIVALHLCTACGHGEPLHFNGMCGAMHCYCHAFTTAPPTRGAQAERETAGIAIASPDDPVRAESPARSATPTRAPQGGARV